MNLNPASSLAAIDTNPEAAQASASSSPATPLLPENCPRILLVDDEPRLLSSLYELLRDRGYHLVTATCGSEALACAASGLVSIAARELAGFKFIMALNRIHRARRDAGDLAGAATGGQQNFKGGTRFAGAAGDQALHLFHQTVDDG